jgi:AcrR family transcriptional regulator
VTVERDRNGTSETDPRQAILVVAERLLAESPDYDISTRAVCNAAGITQPVLYRLFGSKDGLLDAVADAGLGRYADEKAELAQTDDPVADLRAGWDQHTEFARDNPALYQLMFTPRARSHTTARQQILSLIESRLLRCAAVGALAIDPEPAAQLILSANVGVALNLIAEPELFDRALSHRMRETVLAGVLERGEMAADPASVSGAARQLRAQLQLNGSEALEPAESVLLERWLERIADHP